MSAKFRPKSSQVPYENWVLPDVSSSQPSKAGSSVGIASGTTEPSISKRTNTIGQAGIAHSAQTVSKNTASAQVTVVDEEVVAEKVTLAELEKIHEQAHLEGYEEGREEGRKAGHAEGLAQGLAEGRAQADAVLAQQQAQLVSLITALNAPLAQHQQQLALLATELSLAVAEAVIPSAVLASDFKAIAQAVEESLAQLPNTVGRIRVLAHPDEVNAVNECVAVIVDDDVQVSVVAKPDIQQGGCVIKSEHTDIDHLIQTRFDAVAGELRERVALALSHQPADQTHQADDNGSE
ncbi:FliH/SctL family protein [Neptunomonas phycophila]|uniref:Flagellar assembly protein FliH n=1 Tax=Neptunomonas phycophila TaxID=1572645 RepID=A0ABT9EYG8_9GAMM|nr:FliH/SctL family protein [Neptunomonas phycophila]MDP2524093.1 FliH/SctL family protein [Neptunomonas phycophila]